MKYKPPLLCSPFFHPYNPMMLNIFILSRSFKYSNFNTRLGRYLINDWWSYIFSIFNTDPLSARLTIMYNPVFYDFLGSYPIINFRCGNSWYILNTVFNVFIDDSITEICSLYRDGLNLNWRYPPCVFLCVSVRLNWTLFWSLFLYNPLAIWNH